MKTTVRVASFSLPIIALAALLFLFLVRGQVNPPPASGPTPVELAGLASVEDRALNDSETQQLNSLLSAATAAANSIAPGPDAGAQHRAVDLELCAELGNFVTNNPASAWTPAVYLMLARRAQLRCGYTTAMNHYDQAFEATLNSAGPQGRSIALQASGGLAKLLALTGQLDALDQLDAYATQAFQNRPFSSQWEWAREMKRFVAKYPYDAYKCGLYCLDQLGRRTQPGQFVPHNITETPSSTNGFTAGDLLNVGTAQGLRIHAARLTDFSSLPVPAILHLACDHFVLIADQRGKLYEVIDPITVGSKWLTAAELALEATGCVIVSDAAPVSAAHLTAIDAVAASNYRGRCHSGIPTDHNDCGCPQAGPNKTSSSNNSNNANNSNNPNTPHSNAVKVGACAGSCNSGLPSLPSPSRGSGSMPTINLIANYPPSGMAVYGVSDPYMNVWVRDRPLPPYVPAYGPPVIFDLAYHNRNELSQISALYWHGANFGSTANGAWACSLLSFAELDSGGTTAEVLLPAAGWATFTFPSGSLVSSINYQHNMWVQQTVNGSGVATNLTLHASDGSQITYGVADTSVPGYTTFYMSAQSNPYGNSTTFAYDASFNLTTVTAADSTTFTVNYVSSGLISGVSASYGPSFSVYYYLFQGWNNVLTNITDAAGISSKFGYEDTEGDGDIIQLTTPYGTTYTSTAGSGYTYGVFDRTVAVTNADGVMEFYGQINSYGGSDWPDYSSSQIPTNTPIGTLDDATGERQQRNTFYWNSQQFAPIASLSSNLSGFNWSDFKQARIRHWLATTATDTGYTHWDTLSSEQAPSPDGGTTEGQITWYDYVGKPSGANYERGVQTLPSVIARVMPDASTWYQYFIRNTNGLPTEMTEAWLTGSTVSTRSEGYAYAANNIDLVAWTNALGVMALSNMYNAYHQVVTNYDALDQVTTNGYDGTTHLITGSSVPSGLVTLYTYNGSHRLQSIVDLPVNRTNSYTWNSDGTLATQTDPRNMVETFIWDGLHRLTGTSDSRGTTTNLYYVLSGTAFPNSSGGTAILDLTATKDRLGNWTSYVYDPLQRKIAETNANGVVTGYGYCDCGAVNSITNAWNTTAQEVTTFNFNYQGRLTNTEYADSYSVTNWFDSLGRVTQTADGAATRTFSYNNLGLLTVRDNAYGAELTQDYDLLDRPVHITDANGVTVTNTYDNLNRLLTRGYPDTGIEKFGYSASGLIAYTNQLGNASSYSLDALGRKTQEVNADSQTNSYSYNSASDLLSLTDGKNQTIKWTYDSFGRVTAKTNQVGSVVLTYAYDADDQLLSRWSAAMGTTYYTNDAVGNLTYIKYPHSTCVSLQYDWLNRLTNMVDAAGTTKYSYTAGNQLFTESQPFANSTLTNTYVNRLRTAMSLQQPTGLWTNKFVYDAAGRLTNVTSPAGAFAYTVGGASAASSLIKKIALPNSSYITNTYGSVARLAGTYLDNSANTILDSAVYGYNTANQRTAFTNAAGTYVLYSYDNIRQLKVETSSDAAEDRGYTYDAAWNLNYLTNAGTLETYTVDSQNQLTADPNAPTDTYDANGNLQLREWSGLLLYAYTNDDENQLTAIEYDDYGSSPPVSMSQFAYDGLGRMRKRIEYTYNSGGSPVWSTETHYIYDGMRVIQERDTNNAPTRSYTRGPDLSGSLEGAGGIGGLLSMSVSYSAGNWSTHYFYHADGNGNIAYLVDGSQAMAATYRYDPFGNTISSSGSQASANVYRFSSKECNTNSAAYYFGYRFYDPTLQRWLNRDPLGDYGSAIYAVVRPEPRIEPVSSDEAAAMANAGRDQLSVFTRINVNLYSAVGNDPADQADPEGLYGFVNGLWDEFTDPDGYTACYSRCMLGLGTAVHVATELGGGTVIAKKYYTWKYPKWFKAGGKYSKKLVPKLAGKMSACLAPLAIKDAWDCYQECKDRQ